jgi:signal transduction histidine kinase
VLDLPEENVEFSGNESQVRQIVINLLENALKFTPAGGTITLRLMRFGDEANLTVLDTGIGIPPEDLPHLFERFHRGRNTSRYPGSGLGLAITRALVSAHGGSISADSRAGEGTTIIVRLPIS